jgi:hypothetical protein
MNRAHILQAGAVICMSLTLTASEAGTAAADPTVCDLPGVDLACQQGSVLAENTAESGFKAITESMLNGFGRQLEWALSWWVALPSPVFASGSGQTSPVLTTVRDYTSGLQVLLMTGAVILTATRLMMAKRGGLPGQVGLAGEIQESFLGFARAVFGSWMFAAVITAGTRAGDAFSVWVLADITHNDSVNVLARMVSFDQLLDSKNGLGLGAMFLLGTIGFIGALIQLVLLVIRQALLIVVVALLPVAAAATGSGPGSGAYKRMLTWAIAFVLFKPVGALIYVVAFAAAGTPGHDPQMELLGLILLALVALVLPAIMRMVAPAVATMGSGGGGTAGALALGAGAGMLGQKLATDAAGSSGARTVAESSHHTQTSTASTATGNGSSTGGGRTMTGGDTSTNGGSTGGSSTARPASSSTTASPAASSSATGATGGAASTGGNAAAAAGGPWGTAIKAGVDAGTAAVQQVRDQVSREAGPDDFGPMDVRR